MPIEPVMMWSVPEAEVRSRSALVEARRQCGEQAPERGAGRADESRSHAALRRGSRRARMRRVVEVSPVVGHQYALLSTRRYATDAPASKV